MKDAEEVIIAAGEERNLEESSALLEYGYSQSCSKGEVEAI